MLWVATIAMHLACRERLKNFSAACPAEDQAVRNIAVMQVQEIRSAVIGFEHGQVFLPELAIADVPGMQGKEK
jgi:hypothetical protein